MAISLHGHAVRGRYENQQDFNLAWKLQDARKMGADIPDTCISRLLLLYAERCALGDQIERLYDSVPPENVCLVFFDDLKNDPLSLYKTIYRFLEVPDVEAGTFPVLNQKKRIRWPVAASAARILGKAKSAIGINKSFGIADRLVSIASTSSVNKPVIGDNVWKDMDNRFFPQIRKIEYLTGKSLTHWYCYRNHNY